MSTYFDRLVEERNRAWNEAKSKMDGAAAEGRDLSAEEQEVVDRIVGTDDKRGALDELDARIKQARSLEERAVAADAVRESVSRAIVESNGPAPKTDAELFRALFTGEIRSFEARRSPEFMDVRALASAGGSAIPTTFADFVTVYERTLNPVYAVSRVIPTNSGNPIVLPRLTADVTAGGSVTDEAAGITEGDPTISSVTLNAFKKAHITVWSAELNQDEVIGLDQLIADAIARPIGLGWGTDFTTGNGSTTANGFITAGTNGGTAAGTAGNQATDTFFAASDFVDLYYGLPAPYRQNASWMVANTALAKMRKFRDSTGQFLWQPALQAGQPDHFLNRPVYENPAMAAVASASKSVAIGDFSRYIIRDVLPMRVDLSSEYKYSSDQLAIRVVTRRDADLPDVLAIRYLVSANT